MRAALLVGDADDVEPADGSDTLREEVRQLPLSTRAMETDGGRATAFEVLSSAGAVASYLAAQTGERSHFRGQIPSDKTNYRLKLLQDTPESSGWVNPDDIIDSNLGSSGYWTPPADSCGPGHEHFAIVDLQVGLCRSRPRSPASFPTHTSNRGFKMRRTTRRASTTCCTACPPTGGTAASRCGSRTHRPSRAPTPATSRCTRAMSSPVSG